MCNNTDMESINKGPRDSGVKVAKAFLKFMGERDTLLKYSERVLTRINLMRKPGIRYKRSWLDDFEGRGILLLNSTSPIRNTNEFYRIALEVINKTSKESSTIRNAITSVVHNAFILYIQDETIKNKKKDGQENDKNTVNK